MQGKLESGRQRDRKPIMDTRPGKRGIPIHSNPDEGAARRPTARPEQVKRIQDISRGPTKKSRRSNNDEQDGFQDFS